MSSPGAFYTGSGTGPAFLPGAVSRSAQPARCRDSGLGIGPEGVMTLRLAGQPGHGRMAFLRRQPARIVDGRIEGGYTSTFEFICPSCGDHPYLDYSEVPTRLQWLRGPCTPEAGLAEYDQAPQPAFPAGPLTAPFQMFVVGVT
jgi:hypothetical protein